MREVVWWSLVLASLFVCACGESKSSSDASERGGSTSTGGSSGAAPSGGSSGDTTTGGSTTGGSTTGGSTTGGSAGTAGNANPYYQPGTRLKPWVFSADLSLDVIKETSRAGWYDTELDMWCYFRVGTDGVERCYPRSIITSMTYSDAGCTQPVLRTGPILPCGNEALRYVVMAPGGADSCIAEALHMGAQLAPSTPLFENPDGTCQPVTEPGPDDPIVWELEVVPPETFVEMHYASRPRQPGLDAYVREGDDGSWQVVAFSDPSRGPCADLTPVVVTPPRCIPTWAISTGSFSDATCGLPVADATMQDVCTPVEPEVIMRLEFDETSCPSAQRYDLWEVAAVRETALYSDDGSGMCVARPEPPSEVYVAGAPVDVATLPLIDHLEVGTGPLRARFQGFDGVPYVPVWRWPEPFVDSASGQPCKPLEFEDGALRCVPDSVPTASEGGFYYESASCSGTRVALWTPDVDCFPDPPAPLTAVVVATDEVCSTGTIVDTPAVTGRSNATTLYWINPMTGACEGFDWSGNPDRVAYILGESLDPADLFAEVELVLRE